MAKLYPFKYEFLNPGILPMQEDEWFIALQRTLLKIVNTEEGRELLCVDKDFGYVDKFTKNSIRTKIGRDKKGRQRYKTQAHGGSKWANVIRCRWIGFKALARKHYDERDRTRIMLDERWAWAAATDTFFPEVTPGATFDGYAFRTGVDESFATIRAGAGNSSADSDDFMHPHRLFASTTSSQYQQMIRSIAVIDLSSVDDTDSKDSGIFEIWVTTSTDGLSGASSDNSKIVLSDATPASNTAIADGDYSNLGTEDWGRSAKQADITTGVYTPITLSATALIGISLSVPTGFGLTSAFDFDNTTAGLTWSSAGLQRLLANSIEFTGASQSPRVTLTHTASGSPDFEGGYNRYIDIAIDTASVLSSDLADMTIEVSLDSGDSNFWDNNPPVFGSGVRWTLSDNTNLSFVTEEYNVGSEIGKWHMKIPTGLSATDTDIRVHYDADSESNGEDPDNFLDSSYKVFWPLNQDLPTGDETTDLSGGGHTLTDSGTTDHASGRDFDGTANMNAPDSADFTATDGAGTDDSFTAEVSFTLDTVSGLQYLFAKFEGGAGAEFEWQMRVVSGKFNTYLANPGDASNRIGRQFDTVLNTAQEYHGVLRYDGSETEGGIDLLLDGVEVDDATFSAGSYVGMADSTALVTLGASGEINNFLDGKLGLATFSLGISRSDDWCKARSASRKGTWITVGAMTVLATTHKIALWENFGADLGLWTTDTAGGTVAIATIDNDTKLKLNDTNGAALVSGKRIFIEPLPDTETIYTVELDAFVISGGQCTYDLLDVSNNVIASVLVDGNTPDVTFDTDNDTSSTIAWIIEYRMVVFKVDTTANTINAWVTNGRGSTVDSSAWNPIGGAKSYTGAVITQVRSITDSTDTGEARLDNVRIATANIFAIGTSNTAGHPNWNPAPEDAGRLGATQQETFPYVYKLGTKFTPFEHINNRGMDSELLAGIDSDIQAHVIDQGAQVCIVEGGTNDSPTTLANMKSSIQSIMSTLNSGGVKGIICTIPPHSYSEPAETKRTDYNTFLITEVASTSNMFLADIDDALKDPGSESDLLTAFDSGDGIHYSEAGHQEVADTIFAVIEALPTGIPIIRRRRSE